MERPLLCFSIDVEEDMPGWRITDPVTVENARALPRLAELCRDLGVRPTYLSSHPMVTHASSAAILRELHAAGDCEIGTHLHPWNTPPFPGLPAGDPDAGADERSVPSYLCNLGPEIFEAKLRRLHAAIEELTGTPPVSFRAGRYGIDAATLAVLPKLGYVVDTSVTPLVDHGADRGPDFRSAPQLPYRPSRSDVNRRGDLPIVEIPVSIGLTRRVPAPLRRAYARIPRATRIRGLLSKDFLGLVDFTWLYPVRFDLDLMKRGADVLLAAGSPVLNVFLHSSELLAGVSGRVATEADVERTTRRLAGFLEHATSALGARPATLREAGVELLAWPGLEGRRAS